jgi:hypothetical protein
MNLDLAIGFAAGWCAAFLLQTFMLTGWPFRRRRSGHEWMTVIEHKRRSWGGK